jgi:hypothetical protein
VSDEDTARRKETTMARKPKHKPTVLPSRVDTLRAAFGAATGDERSLLARAIVEEVRSRRPEPGRLVRVTAEKRVCGIPPGTYRVKAADAPELGIRVLDLVPPDQPDAAPLLCADTHALALRECACGARGLSEELAWDAARGCCGPCCDKADGADEWNNGATFAPYIAVEE